MKLLEVEKPHLCVSECLRILDYYSMLKSEEA